MADESSSSAIIQSSNMELRKWQVCQIFPTILEDLKFDGVNDLHWSLYVELILETQRNLRARNLKNMSQILQWTQRNQGIELGTMKAEVYKKFLSTKHSKNCGQRYKKVMLRIKMILLKKNQDDWNFYCLMADATNLIQGTKSYH